MNSAPFSEAQRLPPIALVRVFNRVIRALISNLGPLLLVFLFRINRSDGQVGDSYLLYFVYGLMILTVANGLIRYFTFRWQVSDDALIIQHGVFKKVDLRIPFDRIQSIDIQQPWYYRLGHAARFVIDTAGSKSKEAEIWAISDEKALRLQDYEIGRAHV